MNKNSIMKKETNNTTQNESIIQKALRVGGFVFPQTPGEVEEFERQFGNTELFLPEKLKNLDFMDLNTTEPSFQQDLAPVAPNLAMAAREGSKLPDEMLERMRLDRAALKANKDK